MRKIISFMHISLDGFVAGPKGEMDWITFDQELFDHVGKRIRATDSALYGRVTFRMMEDYWPIAGDKPNATKHDVEHSQWYNKAHKIVLSNTLNDEKRNDVTIVNQNFVDHLNEIKQGSGSEILLFGSPTTTHSLIEEGLIDGYWLFVNPIILGHGISLFTSGQVKTRLKLVTSKTFGCGVTEVAYEVDEQ